ncbi:OLC1v1017542C1 [Oldenlandia corymbosa var. corymbosa]|uniref:Laccase n=1 Tax=Oldenlandia corymbosa var. corymbosa TaxID=529605 RepID=A0AAV1E9L7_OLDCO|nr:OLC1v1017542C1 [Oldenlandia corymbosa var. corymbosa]
MLMTMNGLIFQPLFLLLLSLAAFPYSEAKMHKYTFIIKEVPYTRLCGTKNILTVNGKFPGPTLHLRRGDATIVRVHNKGHQNITIHWHGVKQRRNPWSDGPAYITQCPIMPGNSFIQKIHLSDEVGTMWWHAHSEWSRATVHGAIIIYPRKKAPYPFSKPHAEIPIILGEWWKSDIQAVLSESQRNGGEPNVSDAFLINGQPGDFYPCSKQDTFKLTVEYGKTYLLRMINAAMNNILFFAIANHNLTVIGSDGSYLRPYTTDYIAISPGETFDVLLEANQKPDHYYMAAKAYNSAPRVKVDNTTTTGIIEYKGNCYTPSSPPIFPNLPLINDTNASTSFFASLRSLAEKVDVPIHIDTKLFFTISINALPCEANNTCTGPGGQRFSASVSNISFVLPQIDILEAYYCCIRGVYNDQFPSFPPLRFNYTGTNLSSTLLLPTRATKVRVLEYNSNVEIVFQGTNLVTEFDHPMHLHGHSFYVVGSGFGNFDPVNDPLSYNLVDPPFVNTISVPKSGWTTIRFKANNPGVWLMHCHLERHISWGMEMAFLIRNGKRPGEQLLPPPPYMPPC